MNEEEFRERCAIRAGDNAGSSHDHGNCELCDLLERERAEDRAAIRAWLDYCEPYFKETSLIKLPWRVFREWKETHAAAIARATGQEGA